MSDDPGTQVSAIVARQGELSDRHQNLVAADEALSSAVTGAHAVAVESRRRLDEIDAQIENAVAQQQSWSLDTAAGAREFQLFLLARHREITAVVTDAVAAAEARVREVQELVDRYR
jgi:hypothetical protein